MSGHVKPVVAASALGVSSAIVVVLGKMYSAVVARKNKGAAQPKGQWAAVILLVVALVWCGMLTVGGPSLLIPSAWQDDHQDTVTVMAIDARYYAIAFYVSAMLALYAAFRTGAWDCGKVLGGGVFLPFLCAVFGTLVFAGVFPLKCAKPAPAARGA